MLFKVRDNGLLMCRAFQELDKEELTTSVFRKEVLDDLKYRRINLQSPHFVVQAPYRLLSSSVYDAEHVQLLPSNYNRYCD
jgi:hypothetical protein